MKIEISKEVKNPWDSIKWGVKHETKLYEAIPSRVVNDKNGMPLQLYKCIAIIPESEGEVINIHQAWDLVDVELQDEQRKQMTIVNPDGDGFRILYTRADLYFWLKQYESKNNHSPNTLFVDEMNHWRPVNPDFQKKEKKRKEIRSKSILSDGGSLD